MYAIFKAAGKQWRAEPGATIRMPLMAEKSPGDKVSFDEVLLASNGDTVTAGTPTVAGALVSGEVIGHGKDAKVRIFKFKRRKNYRRRAGHRQRFTDVRITDVVLG